MSIKCLLFLSFALNIHGDLKCLSNKSSKECHHDSHNIYSEKPSWSLYLSSYRTAQKSFVPCFKSDCSCFEKSLQQDLAPWSGSELINHTLFEKTIAVKRGILYQIIDHKIYRSDSCMFPARCEGIEYFLNRIKDRLPNVEFILNDRDNPQSDKLFAETGRPPLPIFSFSTQRRHFNDIMYPAWSFWAGGPSIWPLYPTGLGRWDIHRENIMKAHEKWPWSKKYKRGFFRGSRTNAVRDPLVLLSRTSPHLLDAQYTKNQAWKSDVDTLNEPPAKELSFEDHCPFAYLFNYAGIAASFRLRHLFLCGSLVISAGQQDGWQEFFYDSLNPWVHYIPLEEHSTQEEISDLIEFLQSHDEVAQSIARQGYEFIVNHLKMSDIECYWLRLLRRYSRLIKYEVKLRTDAKPIY